jgi:putative nucleotidyltransferase with HDIG domain
MKELSTSGVSSEPLPSEIRFLAVDDDPLIGDLVEHLLIARGLPGEACTDGRQALSILEQSKFQVVVCDLNMPGIGGMGLLEQVRTRFPEVAFVMMTGTNDVRQGVNAIKAGASDYLTKPVQANALVASIIRAVEAKRVECGLDDRRNRLEEAISLRSKQLERARQHIERTCNETLQVLGSALDLRDNETAEHCHRVTRYSLELAKAMGCSRSEFTEIARGAYLHDIGKIGISDSILLKPGPLTRRERAVMESHARIGYDLVRRVSFLAGAAEIVLTHQERFDGTGYPQGLVGHEIPMGARIFAVADTFDAMTSDRPYRCALQFAIARDEILRESGRQFDPEVVDAFLSLPEEAWLRIRKDAQSLRQYSECPWELLLGGI